ncbi:MAG: hypothetical protein ACOY30_10250 [Bacillota bacterium]
MRITATGVMCRHCRQPGVQAGRTSLFKQGQPICDRCYIKLLNSGYRGSGKPMGPGPKV